MYPGYVPVQGISFRSLSGRPSLCQRRLTYFFLLTTATSAVGVSHERSGDGAKHTSGKKMLKIDVDMIFIKSVSGI